MMKIGQFNIDKGDIKALLQSLFITMAIVLSFFIGRLASAYETTMIMNYLAGHPEYNVTVVGLGIRITQDQWKFKPQFSMNNGSMEFNQSDSWGIWDPS